MNKTLTGKDIPEETRGILYLCKYTGDKIIVINDLLFTNPSTALIYYAEIPNPESQVVMGGTYQQLITKLEQLHKDMQDPKWLKELGECL